MKLFLSADIEGTAGIARWEEARPENPAYGYFREQMSKEVAAACRGALAAGAGEVVIKDAHGPACNILPSLLPEGTRITRGWMGSPLLMMEGLDGSYDGVLFTGYHSAAGRDGNPLAHTISSGKIDAVVINGVRASEFLLNAYTAAYYQVPILFLSGDEALCKEAAGQVPGIHTVSTLVGEGNATTSLHPATAVRLLEERVKAAVLAAGEQKPLPLPGHFTVEIRYKDHPPAYKAAFYPGVERMEEKTIRFVTEDYFEVLRLILFVIM